MPTRTTLVTGALGCIGAWTVYHLIKRGERVVSFDLHDRGHRLDLLLTTNEQADIVFVKGDLSDYEQVAAAIQRHNITHIIHLAALQVPFCRANPVRGAQVNVTGTINIFEAARQSGIQHLTYASSIAVYGPAAVYPPEPITHNAPFDPRTLYGVYKQANERAAAIYWQDYSLSSIALRPYTVYGIGRDQGLTSDPTRAMLAAAAGKSYQIGFGSRMQLQLASDVAQQFITASHQPINGAYAFNLGGQIVDMAQVIALIQQVIPGANITHTDNALPFPEAFDDSELKRHFATVYATPLPDGIRQTIEQFQSYLAANRIQAEFD